MICYYMLLHLIICSCIWLHVIMIWYYHMLLWYVIICQFWLHVIMICLYDNVIMICYYMLLYLIICSCIWLHVIMIWYYDMLLWYVIISDYLLYVMINYVSFDVATWKKHQPGRPLCASEHFGGAARCHGKSLSPKRKRMSPSSWVGGSEVFIDPLVICDIAIENDHL